jgi:N-acyl-D-aspartate/D-glutamate deacylase
MSTSADRAQFGAALALLLVGCSGESPRVYDLIVRGGTLIDGSGGAPRIADVGVANGRVAAIGDLSTATADRAIDADGLVVAPGWIDVHSHADLILLADGLTQERLLGAKIAQGVTTLIVGNCGLGTMPSTPESATVLAGVNGWMTPDGLRAGALSVAQYLGRLESTGLVLNAGTLIPHGPVRISAMGLAPGAPSDEQLERMRKAVDRGLTEGAFGMSVGLIYPPGMYSATGELAALAEIVASRDRLFTSHVRGSSEMLIDATRELIEIGRTSGARVHHSHLEGVGERFWPRVADVLAMEDEARANGVRISHDVFPYTRAATMMSAIFPPWALEGGIPRLLERLEHSDTRERIRYELAERTPEWPPWQEGGWPHNLVGAVGWDGILVASVGPGGPAEIVGQSLARIAELESRPPFDVVADLMLSQDGQVGQLVAEVSGSEDRLETLLTILEHPAAAVISDAEDFGRGSPHPAHAGAFARALRLNRDGSLLPLQELVRRMTGYPASLLGLEDRGEIRKGTWADLVVFDRSAVTDRATWAQPRQRAAGVHWVMINGEVVVEHGRYAGGLAGRVLRATRR